MPTINVERTKNKAKNLGTLLRVDTQPVVIGYLSIQGGIHIIYDKSFNVGNEAHGTYDCRNDA